MNLLLNKNPMEKFPIQVVSNDGNQTSISELPEPLIWINNFTSKESKKTYSVTMRIFCSFANITSVEDLVKVTATHMLAFREHLTAKGIAPKTINKNLSIISSLFDHMQKAQLIPYNPVDAIKRFRVNQNRVEAKVLSAQEARGMLDAPNTEKLKGLRDRAILSILFYTGCRISEVCSLQVKNLYEEKGYHVLDFLIKGGKRNRLAIHPECISNLKEYLERAGHQEKKDSPMFLQAQTEIIEKEIRHLNQSTINRMWHKYASLIELEGTSPHSARATFITENLENGTDITMVQKSVGHTLVRTTQTYDKREQKLKDSASFNVKY